MDTAGRIVKELLHEEVSLWYISDEFGSKVMVKIPSITIKALIKGCRVEFTFGKNIQPKAIMFHTGIRIYDDTLHYLSVTGINRFKDEHTSLEKIMNRNSTYVHFHNELNVCVATATLSFTVSDQLKVLNMLNDIETLYVGEFDKDAKNSLDCFDYSLDNQRQFNNVHKIELLIIEANISEWKMMKNTFIGLNESNHMIADDENEGKIFEKQIWVGLESLFNYQLFKNPQILLKKGLRELTDIFAFSDYGLFLFETKAISILSTDANRTMERKVATLQKQIEKGINQLIGAAKKITEKVAVYDSKGNEILFNKELIPHCIVLVSELLPFGNWKEIELKMFTAMVENKIYLNVMDFKEFMQQIGMARGSKDRFDYLLIERVKQLTEHQTIHIKIREAPHE
ncbi:MAG: hypothetical protein M3004_00135 [Bacteroidota bacterium]|nr:hypothetical protein [Bacteroidota bacterium]